MHRVVRFLLHTAQFQYPTLRTASSHNAISLSVLGERQLAYYVPMANTEWPMFSMTNNTFNGDVPVYSPHLGLLTEASMCLNTSARDSVTVEWLQSNFTESSDHWFLSPHQAVLGNTLINFTEKLTTSRYYL